MEVPWPVYKISIAEQRGEKTPNRNQTSIKSLLCNTKTVKMSQTCYFEGYIYSESVITTPKFGVRSAECSSKLTKSKASLRSKYYSIRTIPMIESKCRKMNLYENGLSKIKNYSLRLLQGVIALRDGIGWEIKDSSFEINSSLNKGKEHCTLQWIFYWKILLHHLSFGIFLSHPLTLSLGSPVDSHKKDVLLLQRSEASADAAGETLFLYALLILTSMKVKLLTHTPAKISDLSTCFACSFFSNYWQFELFKEVMGNRILHIFKKTNRRPDQQFQEAHIRNSRWSSELALSGDFLQIAFRMQMLTDLQAHSSLAFQAPAPSGLLTAMINLSVNFDGCHVLFLK